MSFIKFDISINQPVEYSSHTFESCRDDTQLFICKFEHGVTVLPGFVTLKEFEITSTGPSWTEHRIACRASRASATRHMKLIISRSPTHRKDGDNPDVNVEIKFRVKQEDGHEYDAHLGLSFGQHTSEEVNLFDYMPEWIEFFNRDRIKRRANITSTST